VAVDDVLYDTTNIQPGVWYGISCRRYTYTYDEMGNIIKVTRADEDGEAYIYEEYEYDEDGNLIEKRGGLANVTIERELIYMSIEISAEANEIFERIIGINTK